MPKELRPAVVDPTAVGRFSFTGEIRPIAISKKIESEDFKHE